MQVVKGHSLPQAGWFVDGRSAKLGRSARLDGDEVLNRLQKSPLIRASSWREELVHPATEEDA